LNQNSESSLIPDFCIEIDYKKDSENPSRVFRSMSEIIEACQNIDRQLVNVIDVNIETVLLLEDVQTSSIKAWLRTILERVPDDALYNLSWKPVIGQYLVQGKKYIIDFTREKTTVTNIQELTPLSDKIHKLAEATNIKMLPAYTPIQPHALLESLKDISSGLNQLTEGDTAKYIISDDVVDFNLEFRLAPESIEDLITKETTIMKGEKLLKIKKPDYLGESMWDMKHGNTTISVSISDLEWLKNFQSGNIHLVPGDSIRALVRETYKYDHENNLIGQHYHVEEVLEVIHAPDQLDMFRGDNNGDSL